MSDEENEDSQAQQGAAVVELLVNMIEPIKKILEKPAQAPIQSSFS